MGLMARDKGGGDYDPIEEGTHHAICIGVFDIGTHYDEMWGKEKHEMIFMWELPDERIEIEKDGTSKNLPRAISRQFTLSLHKKAQLRGFLEAWRGKTFTDEELRGFDVMKVLGVNCMLQVLHTKKNEKTYANAVSVIPLMKNIPKKEPENPLRTFSFETGEPVNESIPEWIRKKIETAIEWTKKDNNNQQPPVDEDDDIPF